MNNYFAYDPDEEMMTFHPTLEEALQAAEKVIDDYRYLCECDPDVVKNLCVGVLTHRVQIDETHRPPESMLDAKGYDADGNWWGRIDDEYGESDKDVMYDMVMRPIEGDCCQLPNSDELPEWAIKKLNAFINSNNLSESEWFTEWKECCKWVLSLRKPEEKE